MSADEFLLGFCNGFSECRKEEAIKRNEEIQKELYGMKRISNMIKAADQLAEAAKEHLDDPYDCDRRRDLAQKLEAYQKAREK